MKKSLILSLSLLLSLCLGACGSLLEIGVVSEIAVNRIPEYSIEIKEVSLKESSLVVNVSNHMTGEIGSGNERDFFLEVLQGSEWHSIVTDDISNTSEVHTFSGERLININWKSRYGNLPSGRYRLVKYFFYDTEDGSRGGEGFYLADEFEI